MIDRVSLKAFKGSTFDVVFSGTKTLIVGDNGTGKSSIVQAIELVLTGGITGVGRQISAIGDACGAPFTVEVGLSGTDFARSFRRIGSGNGGGIQQTLYVDRAKVSQTEFDRRLGECAAPLIWQPEAFFALGPTMMIAKLVAMFGGYDGEALDEINKQIESAKASVSSHQASARECETTLGRMLQQAAVIHAPAGSMAEVQDEIRKLSEQLAASNAELRELQAQARAAELHEEAKQRAAAAAQKAEARLRDKTPPPQQQPLLDPVAASAAEARLRDRASQLAPRGGSAPPDYRGFVFNLLDRLQAALESFECPTCKGIMMREVVKVERSKLERMAKHGH